MKKFFKYVLLVPGAIVGGVFMLIGLMGLGLLCLGENILGYFDII